LSDKLDRKAVVVVGMHRSGTSAMAKVLSIAGAVLPKDLIPAGRGNEAGHWESVYVANFDDQLLAKLDLRWDSPFAPRRNRRGALPLGRYKSEARQIIRDQYGDESFIVLKEPRITLLIDFWEEVLLAEGFQCSYVIMIRQPEEVAASLNARDQIERNRALLAWATYTSQADLLTRHARRIFCSYDALLENPDRVLDRIEEKLELDLPRRTKKAATEINHFLQPSLRHHHARADASKLGGELSPVSRLAAYCLDLVADRSVNEDIAALTQDWLRSLDDLVSPLLLVLEDQAHVAIAEADSWRALHEQFRTADAQLRSELAEKDLALGALQALEDAMKLEAQRSRDNLQAAMAQEAQTRAELEQTRERLEAVEQARMEEARERAEIDAAMAQARRQAEQSLAHLQRVEQELSALCAEEASRRVAAEEALAAAQARFDQGLAHLHDVEQQVAVGHAEALEAMEVHVSELKARLSAAAEADKILSAEAHHLRIELSNHLTALTAAQEREAETKLELDGLRRETELQAAERGRAQDELARLQAVLESQTRLVQNQTEALEGYKRSILFRSRALILRARGTMLGRQGD
jgi:hypothetical protein